MLAIVLAVLFGSSGQPILPDAHLTPGAVRTTSTTAVFNTRTSTVRNVPESEKQQVYAEYHAKYSAVLYRPGAYEIDHLISLELGGSNDITNLWPEIYGDKWGAHVKDRLENELHRQVCAGSITLKDAQYQISHDWIAAYKKYIGESP